MKTVAFIVFLIAIVPSAAEASFAIALVQGGDPVVHGHNGYQANYDEAPGAIADCNHLFKTTQCRIIAQGSSGCVALANNGAKGTAIRWTVGQARRKDLADQIAQEACQTQFHGNCRVVHDFCQV